MNAETIRDFALSFPNVEECFPFDENTLVFKVNRKMFLLMPLDTEVLRINVKCNPELAIELRESYDNVRPGWHMNKKHWNTIEIDDRLNFTFVQEQIENSYRLVCRK